LEKGEKMRLIGFAAIEYAERAGITLNKLPDHIDEAAEDLSIAEAEALAADDPDLIWLEVGEEEFYGEGRNMEPGNEPVKPPKRAGQRRDELAPGEDSGPLARDRYASDTPFGNAASGRYDGSNGSDGEPLAKEKDEESTIFNTQAGENIDVPQSGKSGGAVEGTPAGKRVRPK
jgi:hypothetical protein